MAIDQPTATLIAAASTLLAVTGGLVVQTLLALKVLASTNANAQTAVQQRDDADRLDAQWERIQWAIDLVLEQDWRRLEVGMEALEQLSDDHSLTELDLKIVLAAIEAGQANIEDLEARATDEVN